MRKIDEWKSLAADHECLAVEEELSDDGGQPAFTVDVVNHAQRQRLHGGEHLQERTVPE